MTPSERAKLWYPSAASGGGNNMAVYNGVGNRFLWKPISDSNGKAAVHTPAGLRIRSITVAGKEHSFGSYGNGWRPLFRLDKPGGAYGSNVPVQLNLHDGRAVTVLVPNGGQRFEKTFAAQDDATPSPGPGPAPAPAGGSITFPASYRDRVALVARVGGKSELCTPDPRVPGRWTHKRPLAPADFYAIRWVTRPPSYVKVHDLGITGLWSYFDDGDFREWPNGQVPVAPVPPPPAPPSPPPAPPSPSPTSGLYTRTPNSLTLAPELAAVVRYVDALANVTHGKDSEVVRITPTRVGNTWTLPRDLGSYPRGKLPNTWRIALAKGKSFPPGVTYHTSISQSFIQETTPAGKFYPPTTRP